MDFIQSVVRLTVYLGTIGVSSVNHALRLGEGRVLREGVIHIGFLSSTKILSPDRKSSRLRKQSGGLSAFFCLLFCSVTLTYRNVQAPSFCFAPASSLGFIRRVRRPPAGGSFVQSSIRIWAGPLRLAPQDPAPSRLVGTRTTSVPHPVQLWVPPAGRTGHICDLPCREPGLQTCLTPDAGERDSEGPKSFRRIERARRRPSNHICWSEPTPKPRSTAASIAHPNTRVRSKFSCRFII